jgi:hypothetical protein
MQFIFSAHPAPIHMHVYMDKEHRKHVLLANYILSHFISIHYHLCVVRHAYAYIYVIYVQQRLSIARLLYIVRLDWHGEKG